MKLKRLFIVLCVFVLTLSACATATVEPAAQPEVETADPTAVTEAEPETAAPESEPTTESIPESTDPKMGGVLVSSLSSDPKNLDPAKISAWDQTVIGPNLHEGLFRLSPDGTEIINAGAESFEVSDDGMVWTFHLRPDAKFHNGRVITAEDYKYSFERVIDPATASPKAWMLTNIVGAKDYQDGTADQVSGIKVVDDKTLEITLAQPLATFKSMLTSMNLSVVPQEAVEEWGEDFGFHVIGAGPFQLGEWNINQDLTINAFEEYWDGRPYLDAVKFRFIGDENTRIVEFDAQNLDIAWVPPAHWDRFYNDPVFSEKLGWAHTFHTDFLAVNQNVEPFGNNPDLRKAIRYALDLDAIIISLQDRATIAQGMLPAGMLAYEDTEIYYPRNLDTAKELMASAGYPDGLDGTYDIILPPWGNLLSMMQIYQANLAEIGINVNITPLEFGPYTEALDSGNYTLAWIYRVPDYPDPDGFYYPLMSSENIGTGGNWAHYSNPEVDEMITAARQSVDEQERVDLYKQIEAQFVEDLPYIPLTHNIYVDVSQPYVMDYTPSPVDSHMYNRVWLDK